MNDIPNDKVGAKIISIENGAKIHLSERKKIRVKQRSALCGGLTVLP
jgi:predicted RNA-binding protein with RPS1 domain